MSFENQTHTTKRHYFPLLCEPQLRAVICQNLKEANAWRLGGSKLTCFGKRLAKRSLDWNRFNSIQRYANV